MSKEVGELEYTDEEALNLGAKFKEYEGIGEVGGDLELHILDKSEENSEEDLDEEEDIGAINLEARIVSKRIKELVNQRKVKSLFMVAYKNENGEDDYRPIAYKDIVILLRATKNWSEVF